jgi:hypothetical protein
VRSTNKSRLSSATAASIVSINQQPGELRSLLRHDLAKYFLIGEPVIYLVSGLCQHSLEPVEIHWFCPMLIEPGSESALFILLLIPSGQCDDPHG